MQEKNALNNERLQLLISDTKKIIGAQGFATHTVFTQPSFIHTVGLSSRGFGADLLIPGSGAVCLGWIKRVATAALEGVLEPIEGRDYASLFGGQSVWLRKLSHEKIGRLMRMSTIMADPYRIKGWMIDIPSLGLSHSTEMLLRGEMLHERMLDERNMV